jgi:hypothetical protein
MHCEQVKVGSKTKSAFLLASMEIGGLIKLESCAEAMPAKAKSVYFIFIINSILAKA